MLPTSWDANYLLNVVQSQRLPIPLPARVAEYRAASPFGDFTSRGLCCPRWLIVAQCLRTTPSANCATDCRQAGKGAHRLCVHRDRKWCGGRRIHPVTISDCSADAAN